MYRWTSTVASTVEFLWVLAMVACSSRLFQRLKAERQKHESNMDCKVSFCIKFLLIFSCILKLPTYNITCGGWILYIWCCWLKWS